MIQIDIEIKKRNRLNEFFHKIHSKPEDLLFTIIQKLPAVIIPDFFINRMEHYTNKRIAELKQKLIRDRWRTIELQKTVDDIHTRQQK